MAWRLGFDIGGTLTDFALQDVATGAIVIGKHLTTPHDPSEGVFLGLADLLRAGVAPEGPGTELVQNPYVRKAYLRG